MKKVCTDKHHQLSTHHHVRTWLKDSELSTLTAGFVAVLVGYASTVALVFQAARGFGGTPAQISSWMLALGIGMGLCSLLPSLWLRKPVLAAWSSPGAAVLATAGSSGNFGMPEAVGAFMIAALLMALVGLMGHFETLMRRIPVPIANALLAGVLARFGLDTFLALQSAFTLVVLMLLSYLLGRRLWPRYAVPVVLLLSVLWAGVSGQLHPEVLHWGWTLPEFTPPAFTWNAMISLALPLFVVNMASQNLPGATTIRAFGYHEVPISKLIAIMGLTSLVLAPFGAFAINLSAISAAICMSPQAHADPDKRYAATVTAGFFYMAVGLFGGVVAGLLAAFPHALVVAIAGLALLGTIGNGLATALHHEPHRESALITFLVTLSGMSLWGIGSAFWGVVIGALAFAIQQWRVKEKST
jgi:benzoate membrane transport protein